MGAMTENGRKQQEDMEAIFEAAMRGDEEANKKIFKIQYTNCWLAMKEAVMDATLFGNDIFDSLARAMVVRSTLDHAGRLMSFTSGPPTKVPTASISSNEIALTALAVESNSASEKDLPLLRDRIFEEVIRAAEFMLRTAFVRAAEENKDPFRVMAEAVVNAAAIDEIQKAQATTGGAQ